MPEGRAKAVNGRTQGHLHLRHRHGGNLLRPICLACLRRLIPLGWLACIMGRYQRRAGLPAPQEGSDMGKRQTFTEAEVRRFIKAGRAEDPKAVVEIVTERGTVRFRPEAESIKSTDEVENWFSGSAG
ncbi:hypothetical protein [Pseudogemmobacter bohemicus]|uniref:hypothetical protein n=1 Tax=Pseudogemmobacter bohemicus TaxID=2250708 RepID=UPI00130023BD|nr:hypothetical protein [Pseudogemmobacter bohemicus]